MVSLPWCSLVRNRSLPVISACSMLSEPRDRQAERRNKSLTIRIDGPSIVTQSVETVYYLRLPVYPLSGTYE